MKPSPFQYFQPATVDEALALLHRHQPGARILAGGQSLVPLLNFRRARPEYLIDINHLEDLRYIRENADTVCIGAMVRQTEIEQSELIAEKCPILAEATRYIGYRAVRNRGTIGGSLAHADPSAEYPAVLLAVNGEVTARGPGGARRIRAEDLFVNTCTTALGPDEILTEVRLPALSSNQHWSFLELSRGYSTIATVGVAVLITLDENKRCAAVRIAVAGAGATPLRCREAEDLLTGQRPTAVLVKKAAAASAAVLRPSDELQAPAAYKQAMAEVYIERAVKTAVGQGGLA
jgi:carbon-monoxide dehydrogenase medium subunit